MTEDVDHKTQIELTREHFYQVQIDRLQRQLQHVTQQLHEKEAACTGCDSDAT